MLGTRALLVTAGGALAMNGVVAVVGSALGSCCGVWNAAGRDRCGCAVVAGAAEAATAGGTDNTCCPTLCKSAEI